MAGTTRRYSIGPTTPVSGQLSLEFVCLRASLWIWGKWVIQATKWKHFLQEMLVALCLCMVQNFLSAIAEIDSWIKQNFVLSSPQTAQAASVVLAIVIKMMTSHAMTTALFWISRDCPCPKSSWMRSRDRGRSVSATWSSTVRDLFFNWCVLHFLEYVS